MKKYSKTMHSANYKRILYSIITFITNIFCPNYGWGLSLRGILIKPLLKSCGSNFKVSRYVQIEDPDHLEVGNNVFLGYNSFIGSGPVKIEDEVVVGPFVSITAGDHTSIDGSFRFGKMIYENIMIGKGSWVCSHVSITKGVKIGKSNLIAANAVVTKSTEDCIMTGGIPAKKIKDLPKI